MGQTGGWSITAKPPILLPTGKKFYSLNSHIDVDSVIIDNATPDMITGKPNQMLVIRHQELYDQF